MTPILEPVSHADQRADYPSPALAPLYHYRLLPASIFTVLRAFSSRSRDAEHPLDILHSHGSVYLFHVVIYLYPSPLFVISVSRITTLTIPYDDYLTFACTYVSVLSLSEAR
jgi:hypothetical protein